MGLEGAMPERCGRISAAFTGDIMDQLSWILWLVLGVALIVAEVFTLGFFLIFFGVGAIAAALAAMVGVGTVGQFLSFCWFRVA